MKKFVNYLIIAGFLLLLLSCNSSTKQQSDKQDDRLTYENVKLEEFFNLPIYPGAEMVMLITNDRDDEIPEIRKPATVSLVVDNRDSVPVFYERVLGLSFQVDTVDGHPHYSLTFEKEGWDYEIYVGEDSFENKPMFDISMLDK